MAGPKRTPLWQFGLFGVLVLAIVATAAIFVGGIVKAVFFPAPHKGAAAPAVQLEAKPSSDTTAER